MIRRRHVYHVAGYDPIDAGAQYRRFTRQLEVFRRTWNVEATLSALEASNEQSRAWWTVSARGANWQVEAGHEALLWDDIVRGFEWEKDEYVVLSDEELERANVRATHTIDIIAFVDDDPPSVLPRGQ